MMRWCLDQNFPESSSFRSEFCAMMTLADELQEMNGERHVSTLIRMKLTYWLSCCPLEKSNASLLLDSSGTTTPILSLNRTTVCHCDALIDIDRQVSIYQGALQ
mmetsp:Transcript_3945/g.9090  ORF Transcript_3945/g.9090 Transcript_3945/m.9090 type:complete len:104 (-) Transcript_3945:140-451(-)